MLGVLQAVGAEQGHRPQDGVPQYCPARLTDGNDVRKLRVGEPRILHHRLVVYERQHGVAATEVERANLREYNKQF